MLYFIRGLIGYVKRCSQYLIRQKTKYSRLGIPISEILRLQRSDYLLNTETILLHRKIKINSPYWYLHGIKEIFIDESYLFETNKVTPLIIDCGANTGLSVIFFKQQYPDSRIIAFEPDPLIFEILNYNVDAFQLSGIQLHKKAVWKTSGVLSFMSDGGVGGSLSETEEAKFIKVDAVRLRDYLENQKIDFLKIDIEGSEYQVLEDCREVLGNVENIFVEYHSSSQEEQRLDEILSILKNAGFRVYVKEAWVIKERPFLKSIKGLFDLQLNIFGYKEK